MFFMRMRRRVSSEANEFRHLRPSHRALSLCIRDRAKEKKPSVRPSET